MATAEVEVLSSRIPCRSYKRMRDLCGPKDEYICLIRDGFDISIEPCRDNSLIISGPEHQTVSKMVYGLLDITDLNKDVVVDAISGAQLATHKRAPILYHAGNRTYQSRSEDQWEYMSALNNYRVNFGIGPAGTGKTLLPVAKACELLDHEIIRKIIIARPTVEAGENLGFLPGGIEQKVDPYLRPIVDAFDEIYGMEAFQKMLEKGQIEMAGIGFMRGRTLKDAYILFDETQNTTVQQMRMLITRLGPGSYMTFTGDISQKDTPSHVASGLQYAMDKLEGKLDEVHFTHLTKSLRDPLVDEILTYIKEED